MSPLSFAWHMVLSLLLLVEQAQPLPYFDLNGGVVGRNVNVQFSENQNFLTIAENDAFISDVTGFQVSQVTATLRPRLDDAEGLTGYAVENFDCSLSISLVLDVESP